MPERLSWQERKRLQHELDRKARENKRLAEATAQNELVEQGRQKRRELKQLKVERVLTTYNRMALEFERQMHDGPQQSA